MDRQAGADSSSAAQADGAVTGFAHAETTRGSAIDELASATASTLGQKVGPVRTERRIDIAFNNAPPKEEWLSGKLLEHSVTVAIEAMRQYRSLEATITVGERVATVKVSA